jgi:mRNA interferase MazF
VATPEPRRGEIWWVDWATVACQSPGRGSEQTGRDPAVIVQTDPANLNPRYPNTIVAAVSTKGRGVRSHVQLNPTAENGLTAPSFVKCEQLMTLSKARLDRRLGQLTPTDLERVAAALRIVLAL